jgi:hypothetical protein
MALGGLHWSSARREWALRDLRDGRGLDRPRRLGAVSRGLARWRADGRGGGDDRSHAPITTVRARAACRSRAARRERADDATGVCRCPSGTLVEWLHSNADGTATTRTRKRPAAEPALSWPPPRRAHAVSGSVAVVGVSGIASPSGSLEALGRARASLEAAYSPLRIARVGAVARAWARRDA